MKDVVKDNKVNIKKRFINYLTFDIISLVILIISFTFINKIKTFSKLFGSFNGTISGFGVKLYFICLAILIIYLTSMIIYYLIINKKNKDFNTFLKIDKIFDIPDFILKCLSYLLFIMIFLITPCNVSGASMESTISNNDKVLATSLVSNPNKNDVVIFDAKRYNGDNNFYIKRVIAKENDVIRYDSENEDLYVNDILVEDNMYLYTYILLYKSYYSYTYKYDELITYDTYLEYYRSISIEIEYTFTMPESKFMCFGDNRENSSDSRIFGFVEKKDILGKVFFRIFPFSKIGTL